MALSNVKTRELQRLLQMKGDRTPFWGGYDIGESHLEVRLGCSLEHGGNQKVLLRFPYEDIDLDYIARCIDKQLAQWSDGSHAS